MRYRSLSFRVISLVAIGALALPSFAAPIEMAADSLPNLIKAIKQLTATRPGPYSDVPGNVYVGPNPGRDDRHRGGVFTEQMYQDFEDSANESLIASIDPTVAIVFGGAPTQYNNSTGSPYAWENNWSVYEGNLNTNNGNRTSKTLGGVTDTYTYDNADKLQSTSSKTYGYDAAGRTTSVTTGAGTTTLSYDYEDRVTSITLPSSVTDTFTYNGVDTRVGKTDSTGTYSYMRDGVGVTDPVLNDTAAEYTPGISENRSGTSAFYHADRLGSTTKISNSSAGVTDSRQYDAFGMLVSSSGTNPTPFGFAGQEGYQSDPDSGLMLLGHRYYDSSIGRFLSRDPAQQGRNWYDYCSNNPERFVDPRGEFIFLVIMIVSVFVLTIENTHEGNEGVDTYNREAEELGHQKMVVGGVLRLLGLAVKLIPLLPFFAQINADPYVYYPG